MAFHSKWKLKVGWSQISSNISKLSYSSISCRKRLVHWFHLPLIIRWELLGNQKESGRRNRGWSLEDIAWSQGMKTSWSLAKFSISIYSTYIPSLFCIHIHISVHFLTKKAMCLRNDLIQFWRSIMVIQSQSQCQSNLKKKTKWKSI